MTSRAYLVELCGMSGCTFAASAGKARYHAALSAHDAGFLRRPDPSQVRARRLPALDAYAERAAPRKCYALDFPFDG
jgi:hypothetical protein